MLAIYQKWNSRLFAKAPKPDGDFRYYVNEYCGDVMNKLAWSGTGKSKATKAGK